MKTQDIYNLQRFLSAQEGVYSQVLTELWAGRKRSHWMWYIFPQVNGLGYSATSKHYAIKSKAEAQHYRMQPVLGARLIECSQILLTLQEHSPRAIFGSPDDLKLQSCMTLFASISDVGSVFSQVLDKYFQGEWDRRTLSLLV